MSETLAARAAFTLDARHSRFLAQAAPAPSPEAALAFLAEDADAGATPHSWAYRKGSAYRSSDDGEPAGTSGRPILAAIDGQGLDQVMVVVTRWYGGIKLGAGGLVRAYGGSAAECLRTAPRRMLVTLREFALFAGFEDLGAVHAALAATGAQKLEETFDADGVRLRVSVAEDAVEALRLRVRDMTRGRAEVL
jgi:putative IMPACT (imprinted ancient) family translation regulator